MGDSLKAKWIMKQFLTFFRNIDKSILEFLNCKRNKLFYINLFKETQLVILCMQKSKFCVNAQQAKNLIFIFVLISYLSY